MRQVVLSIFRLKEVAIAQNKLKHLHTNLLHHTNRLHIHQTHTVAAGTDVKVLHMRRSCKKLVEFTSAHRKSFI